MDVHRIAPGLWRWTAYHEEWRKVVGSLYIEIDEATVRKVERLLYLAEYKRRQAAPVVKVTRKNFGRDRRYPITNKFRDRG